MNTFFFIIVALSSATAFCMNEDGNSSQNNSLKNFCIEQPIKMDADCQLRVLMLIHDCGVPVEELDKLDMQSFDSAIFNRKDSNYGYTVAHCAASNPDQAHVVKYLLKKGVDFTIKNRLGQTPYTLAVINNSVKTLKILKENNITE